MLCLSFSSQSACLPPSPSLSARRRSVGAERSRLVKRLPDDRKIRGILLLTGCCVCAFFFSLPPFLLFLFFLFFCSKCFLSVCFQSSCLGSTISAASPRAQTHAHTRRKTMRARACVRACALIGDRSDFVFSDWWQWWGGGGRGAIHSQRRLPLR